MSPEKDKKKKPRHHAGHAEQTQKPQTLRSGQILRQARLDKGLELEQVSSAIHVRAVQLRAIEEGEIEALPGMTYALGFVRSYANFLKLDSTDIIHKFKTEHGMAGIARPELHFPEPLASGHQPDPVMIGTAAFFAILLLLLWAIFSDRGSDEALQIAEQIPPAPVVATLAESMAPAAETIPAAADAAALTTPAPAATTETAAPPAAASAEKQVAPQKPPPPAVAAAPITVQKAPAVAEKAPEQAREIIDVKPGRGRIVLKSTQTSWVQVNDSGGKAIFKKVMRPGEQYYVPEEKGLTLITSNAGGLEIYVDGTKARSVGRQGEIVRGIALNPSELKKQKIRSRE
jgi:cytoskeleton protein RodZ